MRNIVKLSLVAATALAVSTGCVQPPPLPSPTTVTRPPAEITATPISVPDEKTATAALLTAKDLGQTFTDVPTTTSPPAQLGVSLYECTNESDGPDPKTTVEATYMGGTSGPFIAETITVSSEQYALHYMSALAKVTTNCGRFGSDLANGSGLNVALDELAFPRLGEDTVAFRLSATAGTGGMQVFADLITVRTANVTVLVAIMQLTQPDPEATRRIVEVALDKATRQLFH